MNVGFGARSTDFEKYFGHSGGLILDLEAETLPETRSFDAAPAHMGLEGWFLLKLQFFHRGRVEAPPKVFRACLGLKFGLGG